MSGYRNGYLNLDSPRNVFYAGQVVSGNVVFVLEQPFTLSVLSVNFLGEANVIWAETESETYNGVTRYKNIDYVGREEYFNFTQILAGGSAPINLPPGTHTYKFSYQIPPGVPSTYNGDRGSITYCAKAYLELRSQVKFKEEFPRPFEVEQVEVKEEFPKPFEVIAPFDLNLGSPKLKEPIDLLFEEVYSCGCFCSSAPVSVLVRLPVSGYCPGQVVPVALQIDNSSSVEIRKMIFQILKREKFHTQRPIAEYVPPEEVLCTVKQGAVMSGTKRNLTIAVRIPDLIAPNLENCGIIDVGFFFRVIIKLSGCNDDLEDEAEICLGLLPLNETLEGEYVHPLAQDLPVGPIPDIPPTNQEDVNRQFEAHQQSAYPNFQPGYPNGPPPFPNAQPVFPSAPPPFSAPQGENPPDSNVQSSYFVQVQQQQYSSSDPSKNFNIGFTMKSPNSTLEAELQPLFNNLDKVWASFPLDKDLRIHMPQPSVNVNVPSAPPPST